ncbi:hypothetical protein CK203_107005 [Vitis vinifera]|uniref:Uncharacterized protein n=1 Tax=Vitis vinifera TaxID=29760 RepID=A0A438CVZ6_VITVI|nr:hypothetical protein CK203_107005 [Vitis vinifera]
MLTESVDFFSFSDDDEEVNRWNKWVCRVTKRHNTRENWSWREKGLKEITEGVRGYFCPNWVILRPK